MIANKVIHFQRLDKPEEMHHDETQSSTLVHMLRPQ